MYILKYYIKPIIYKIHISGFHFFFNRGTTFEVKDTKSIQLDEFLHMYTPTKPLVQYTYRIFPAHSKALSWLHQAGVPPQSSHRSDLYHCLVCLLLAFL